MQVTPTLLTAVALGAAAVSVPPPAASAPDSPGAPRVQDVQVLASAVYGELRGRPGPAAKTLGWAHAFFQGEAGHTYVPYTLTVPRTSMPGRPVLTVYVYVTTPGAAVPVERSPDPDPDDTGAPAAPATVFEAAYLIDLGPGADERPGPYRIRRALSVPAGDYTVYVALAATPAPGDTTAVDPAAVLITAQHLAVPDLWSSALATSSIVVADRVEPLPADGPPAADAHALGAFAVVPADDADFRQSDELSVIFGIYNPGLTRAGKPDVSVEYRFYRRDTGGASYFSRTAPQVFSAQTAPEFDAAAGHQLFAGQAVSLRAFPAGAYRLEIEIVDRIRRQTIVRMVDFAVQGS